MNQPNGSKQPMRIPVEAYTSPRYARAESDKLWSRVWQVACRVEEIPEVGDYVTYDILDQSIIVVRTSPDEIVGYYNVCLHRGRRLTEGCGRAKHFYCRFHGWRWNLDGENAFVLDREDWGDALTADNLRLPRVQLDTWGGYVWINMDPGCEPLRDYLGEAGELLDQFELDRMRYRWRQWLYFPCNWKTALEAFNESYHVEATHPQLTKWGTNTWWSRAVGKHACHGTGPPRENAERGGVGFGMVRSLEGQDPRVTVAEQLNDLVESLDATTTDTIVGVANRLVDELPAGTSSGEVAAYMMETAKREDAARGVVWPEVDPERLAFTGFDWHLFPNSVLLPSLTTALCYRARPNGYDPDSCIFEVYTLERFPEGEEPATEWVFEPDLASEKWRKILPQDFGNMPEVQKGMKSRGFSGARPSPVSEVAVTHFHEVLSEYMGTGAPEPIESSG